MRVFLLQKGQKIYKPGSVLTDHLSSLNVAIKIKRIITIASSGKLTLVMGSEAIPLQQTGFTTW